MSAQACSNPEGPTMRSSSHSWMAAIALGFAIDAGPALADLPKEHQTRKDGAPMVLIPAGTFKMGSTKDEVDRAIRDCIKELKEDQPTCEGWYKPELLQHKVQIDTFYPIWISMK